MVSTQSTPLGDRRRLLIVPYSIQIIVGEDRNSDLSNS